MRALEIAATALNAGLYATLGLTFYYIFPLTAPGLGLVRFWPQVIIPAIFAALFGPWVGGTGAMVGIFINDMFIHGNPILSLMAGVSSNFVGFFIVGYVSKKTMGWKIPMLALGVISIILVGITEFVLIPDILSAEMGLAVSGVILGTYVMLLIIVLWNSKWRGYEVGCMIGLLLGSVIIGTMVPVFSEIFILPGNTVLTPLSVSAGLWYLVWTFGSEIPFMIILGPPILEACYKAFPSLKLQPKE